MTAPVPDPATVVQNEVFPPGPPPPDTIILYEGANQAQNGFSAWKSWDMRGWLNRLAWDLLRFKKIDDGKPNPDRTVSIGLRDQINAIHYLVDQNNQLLQALVKQAATPNAPTAAVKTAAEVSDHQAQLVDAVREHLVGQEEIYRAHGVANPGLLEQAGLHVTV